MSFFKSKVKCFMWLRIFVCVILSFLMLLCLSLMSSEGLHTHMFTYSTCTVRTAVCKECLRPCTSVSGWMSFWDSCARAAWVFMGAFMTSGSGNVDIWFPSQSEGYLTVWVWSDEGGGLQYILTRNWGKETEQATEGKLRRASNRETNFSRERN